jgi:NAD(P)-dependent dehydrogenase (short-subunit alcohol dehydrogenase family)
MEETNTLHGRAVLITGGGTGIGRATAQQFAAAGAEVLIIGRTAERLAETAKEHPRIRTFVADIAAPNAPVDIVAAAVDAFGRIDVLVNNAAITRPAPLEAIDRKVAEEQLATFSPRCFSLNVLCHTWGPAAPSSTSHPIRPTMAGRTTRSTDPRRWLSTS